LIYQCHLTKMILCQAEEKRIDMKNFIKRILPPPLERIARIEYRRMTAPLRSLPDFLIIGAQKCGTTSLFYYLCQHPQIMQSSTKEVHYFDGGLDSNVDTYEKGQYWYRTHFPLKSELKEGYITGEASVLYIFHPLAASRIYELVPNVKMIALLRNPTERAISHYFYNKRRQKESLDIMDAFRAEEQRMKSTWESGDYKNDDFRLSSYKTRGLYQEQLERYLDFFSKEQMLILCSEDFFKEPRNTLTRVCKFLDIETDFTIEDPRAKNVSDNNTELPAEVHEYLDDYYKIPNQALFDQIGRTFKW